MICGFDRPFRSGGDYFVYVYWTTYLVLLIYGMSTSLLGRSVFLTRNFVTVALVKPFRHRDNGVSESRLGSQVAQSNYPSGANVMVGESDNTAKVNEVTLANLQVSSVRQKRDWIKLARNNTIAIGVAIALFEAIVNVACSVPRTLRLQKDLDASYQRTHELFEQQNQRNGRGETLTRP